MTNNPTVSAMNAALGVLASATATRTPVDILVPLLATWGEVLATISSECIRVDGLLYVSKGVLRTDGVPQEDAYIFEDEDVTRTEWAGIVLNILMDLQDAREEAQQEAAKTTTESPMEFPMEFPGLPAYLRFTLRTVADENGKGTREVLIYTQEDVHAMPYTWDTETSMNSIRRSTHEYAIEWFGLTLDAPSYS